MACRVTLIKWVVQYMHRSGINGNVPKKGPTPDMSTSNSGAPPTLPGNANQSQDDDGQHESSHHSLDSSKLNKVVLKCCIIS